MSAEQNGLVVCVGHVWVDSGQILLCDPSYVADFDRSTTKERWSYEGACEASGSKLGAGIIGTDHRGPGEGMGAVCSTHEGDGVYPVLVRYNADGQVSEVAVRFDRRSSWVAPL